MKKMVSMVICFCMLVCLVSISMTCNASEANNRIYADKVTAVAGEEITIPIKIAGNSGFMGFAMTIHYDPEVFTPLSVEASELLTGLFNDSIATSQSGSFDVVFTNSADITEDGTLFTVVLQTASEVYGSKSLSITYSAEDTFNENWDPVELSTEPVIVEFPAETPVEPEPTHENLSEKIRKWIAGLRAPFNKIFKVLLSPIIWLIRLFE